MSFPDEREQAFEYKFAHDEALRFKLSVRRNTLFGAWAAQQLRFVGSDAEAYRHAIADLLFQPGGQRELLDRVIADLARAGSPLTPPEVRAAFARFETIAKRDVMAAEGPPP